MNPGPPVRMAIVARVIVVTTFDTDEMVLRALRIGAAGFLLKDTPPDRLVEAVKTVVTGAPTLSPQVTAQLIAAATTPGRDDGNRARDEARRRLAELTGRELEVARGVGRGRSNAELYMSIATGRGARRPGVEQDRHRERRRVRLAATCSIVDPVSVDRAQSTRRPGRAGHARRGAEFGAEDHARGR